MRLLFVTVTSLVLGCAAGLDSQESPVDRDAASTIAVLSDSSRVRKLVPPVPPAAIRDAARRREAKLQKLQTEFGELDRELRTCPDDLRLNLLHIERGLELLQTGTLPKAEQKRMLLHFSSALDRVAPVASSSDVEWALLKSRVRRQQAIIFKASSRDALFLRAVEVLNRREAAFEGRDRLRLLVTRAGTNASWAEELLQLVLEQQQPTAKQYDRIKELCLQVDSDCHAALLIEPRHVEALTLRGDGKAVLARLNACFANWAESQPELYGPPGADFDADSERLGQEALVHYTDAVQHGRSVRSLLRRARQLSRMGETEAALRDANTALTIDPASAEAFMVRADSINRPLMRSLWEGESDLIEHSAVLDVSLTNALIAKSLNPDVEMESKLLPYSHGAKGLCVWFLDGDWEVSFSFLEDYCKSHLTEKPRTPTAEALAREVTPSGVTPLHMAPTCLTPTVFERLLTEYAAGVDLNIKDNVLERTPLHIACVRGDLRTVQMLLRRGADLKTESAIGKTALDEMHSIGKFLEVSDPAQLARAVQEKLLSQLESQLAKVSELDLRLANLVKQAKDQSAPEFDVWRWYERGQYKERVIRYHRQPSPELKRQLDRAFDRCHAARDEALFLAMDIFGEDSKEVSDLRTWLDGPVGSLNSPPRYLNRRRPPAMGIRRKTRDD